MDGLVFNCPSSFDHFEIRRSILRIPEVSVKIREAQSVLDHATGVEVDLLGYWAADEDGYGQSIRLKRLLTTVVQLALYERYVRFNGRPLVVAGICNDISPLQVITGEKSFVELVLDSCDGDARHLQVVGHEEQHTPVLSGMALSRFGAYALGEKDQPLQPSENLEERELPYSVEKLGSSYARMSDLLKDLIQNKDFQQIVKVGPGDPWHMSYLKTPAGDLLVSDSIEIDPVLTWFWKGHETVELVAAIH